MTKFTILAAAFAVVAGSASAATVVNGSFEDPTGSGAFQTYDPGSGSLTGWTISGANIDHISGYWEHSDGVRSIDMNGNGGGASISQMVTNLVIGRSYTLLFDMAGNPDDSPVRKDLFAAIAGFSDQFSFYTTGRTRTDMGWTTMSLDFVANDTSHLLQFDSITDGAAYGPALDNVRIVDATPVPVPAAGLLLLTALGGIGLAKRRKS
ncbi:choice-of-anchor C family protein [Pseudooceanicola sp.]|uniref:choice-of-anchor C family protein n=1 Tax=Pseudooceanicola sp. TaxID=1914328 RepID=UPI0035C6879C